MNRVSHVLSLFLALSISLQATGCGQGNSDGPERFQVSGIVKFDGEPLPFGTIVFEPDSSKGNSGPQGFAEIKNGVYDTGLRDGRGSTGGPMVISIQGKTEEVVTEGSTGRFLFQDFHMEKDLPKEKTTLDIDIPKEATDPKARKSPARSPQA
ncbi:MAG TPA: hypothetical protein VNQ76_08285 [Planctomicrobium sp.]|nr:hypothetical protein [Planctomicrobium sp.]